MMKFNKSIIEIIQRRTSRRTYVPKMLDDDLRERVNNLIRLDDVSSPFAERAGKCRFKLVAVPEFNPKEKKKLGTYGIIKGAQEFIVGAVEKSDCMKEHFGYLMECIVLGATDLDLGTCWLGGFFNKSLFSEKLGARQNEIVPAITPIGYPEKRRTKEVAIRKFVRAEKRHPWERLFYEGDFQSPIISELDDKIKTMLTMVQLGPSAGNKQPWRIVKELDKNHYHFYIKKVNGIYQQFQPLDMGIAVCHWNLTSRELKIEGNWEFKVPDISGSEDFKYIISWMQN